MYAFQSISVSATPQISMICASVFEKSFNGCVKQSLGSLLTGYLPYYKAAQDSVCDK